MNEDSWQDVGSNAYVKWDAPKEIVGVYEGFTVVPNDRNPDKPQRRHTVTQDDGEAVEFFGTAILNSRLDSKKIVVGLSRVRIVYEGKTVKTKSGMDAKDFVVQVAGAE